MKNKNMGSAAMGPIGVIGTADLNAQSSAFTARFRLNGGGALQGVSTSIAWKAIAVLFPEGDSNAEHPAAALKVHYGLDGEVMRYAVEALKVGAVNSAGEYPLSSGELYLVVGDGLMAQDRVVWNAIYKAAYLSKVQVDRSGDGTFVGLNDGASAKPDPTAMIFPWDQEVWSLYQDNAVPGTKAEDLRIVLVCGAVPYEEGPQVQKGFGHTICMHMERLAGAVYIPLLKGGSPLTAFTGNAANVGHPCPPSCDLVAFGKL